ncbi:hypothetical protein DEO72_LG4g310 [Vigna unguiculata]|uniref:Uncharacterized protein n=1 Tax=Vigna unguiculata TaxID=3917 RepID=A0A4D6LM98_VIGUN|nr:hypothetical protein DEO72_LG4g310 [Vigna unguiculata]
MSNSLLVSLFPKSKQDQGFPQCTSMSKPNNIFFLLIGFIANIQPGYQSPPSSPFADCDPHIGQGVVIRFRVGCDCCFQTDCEQLVAFLLAYLSAMNTLKWFLSSRL